MEEYKLLRISGINGKALPRRPNPTMFVDSTVSEVSNRVIVDSLTCAYENLAR